MEYPEFSVDKKCPKSEGRMGYYETELDDGGNYLCNFCNDCGFETYAYSDEEMQEICNELEDWRE